MPQPDSGDNCCDCPSRASPCDDCVGACCSGTSCTITTSAGCSGDYQGNGTDCDPNPCGSPTGACCKSSGDNIVCFPDLHEVDCTAGGGYYLGDNSTCNGSPCSDAGIGACCYGCTNPCTLTTHDGCPPNVNGGDGWLGAGLSCESFGFENICCPNLPDAQDCCVAGTFAGCFAGSCSDVGGCPWPCSPDGSPCSCVGIPFDAESQFGDPFFINN